ncbi:MAG: chromosomal replication initiator protein DnaA [Candidatus Bipolaricaulia bacterium]
MEPKTLWETAKKEIADKISQASFETWFGDTAGTKLDGEQLIIEVPNEFIKSGLTRRYRDLITSVLTDLTGKELELHIITSGRPSSISATPTRLSKEEINSFQTKDVSGELHLKKEYIFENFIRGKNNQLAFAAAMAVAKSPGEIYNPLFIHGNVGLGKTHLLQAIGNYLADHGHYNVIYTSSERFTIEMIDAIQRDRTAAFRNKYRVTDVLLIDDVHFLKDKEGTQEELFHTFNELYQRNRQIVLSSDRSPRELTYLQDRLVSRFRWGLVADIQPPNFETRVAILKHKARQNGLEIKDEILNMIATRVASNIRALEGALLRVVAQMGLQNGEIDTQTVEDLLPEEEERVLNTAAIKEEVSRFYGVSIADLEGESRKEGITHPRHIAIYLSRELTDSSFPEIGREFGDRAHTTIMHSYKTTKKLLKEIPLFQTETEEIRENLLTKFKKLSSD